MKLEKPQSRKWAEWKKVKPEGLQKGHQVRASWPNLQIWQKAQDLVQQAKYERLVIWKNWMILEKTADDEICDDPLQKR